MIRSGKFLTINRRFNPLRKFPGIYRGSGKAARESMMSRVNWNLVEAELRATSAPKAKNDRAASEPSEADLLKHIEDALLMDTVNPDRTGARRG
jgi:hypothetical protein